MFTMFVLDLRINNCLDPIPCNNNRELYTKRLLFAEDSHIR